MIQRAVLKKLNDLKAKFPVVTVTGTRQCGKSTLLRTLSGYEYVSLEDPDIREQASGDPRGFLGNFEHPLIIDEAQYAPKLFSYIQTRVDSDNRPGMYILSGSHNFLLMESISQSLAGRTAILKMAPFSTAELKAAGLLPGNVNDWLFTGGFPRIYDQEIAPSDFFPNYIQTYIERDVRLLRNIDSLSAFIRFLKLCAARIGQLLNVSSLANECDISVPTAKAWLSVLEASYVIFLLNPFYRNYNKRLVKSPKLYFCDTGLAASLLGLQNREQLETHYLHGGLFENMVIAECLKSHYAQGKEPQMYFWRDNNQNEVDLLVEDGISLNAYEVKSSATMNRSHFKGLKTFRAISGLSADAAAVIYGGEADFKTADGRYVSWKNCFST